MDLLTILPTFNTKPYTHILPPLERRHITTVDLITLDYLEIAKRAHVPPADVRRLCADVVVGLHGDLGYSTSSARASTNDGKYNNDNDEVAVAPEDGGRRLDLSRWNTISTLDSALDELLGGGIPTGYLTEITGESGSGKTQFLLNLVLAAQLPSPRGLGRKAIYISTEAPLSTPRLSQILQSHPYLSNLPATEKKPSLANVLSITAIDLETQDHILNYQLPVAIQRYNVGLVVIDSIAANYRAEHTSNSMQGLSARSGELAKLGHMLRNLAVKEDVAIVVANQVSDRFDGMVDAPHHQHSQQHGRFPWSSQTPLLNRHTKLAMMEANDHTPSSSPGLPSSSSIPSSPSPSQQFPAEDDAFDGAYIIGHPVRNETLSLSHQQKFFTGWGDEADVGSESQKTPALGFVWSTQIACRIALKKEEEIDKSRVAATAAANTVQPFQNPHRNGTAPAQTEIKTAKEVTIQSSPLPPSSSIPIPSQNEDSTPTKPSTTTNATTTTPRAIERITRRRLKLVFAPWTSGVIINNNNNNNNKNDNELDFEIWKGGLRSLSSTTQSIDRSTRCIDDA